MVPFHVLAVPGPVAQKRNDRGSLGDERLHLVASCLAAIPLRMSGRSGAWGENTTAWSGASVCCVWLDLFDSEVRSMVDGLGLGVGICSWNMGMVFRYGGWVVCGGLSLGASI